MRKSFRKCGNYCLSIRCLNLTVFQFLFNVPLITGNFGDIKFSDVAKKKVASLLSAKSATIKFAAKFVKT